MNALELQRVDGWATVQDLGRQGWQHLGLAPGGAVDPDQHRLAQRLISNPETAAGIELALGGLALQATEPLLVAITGAPANPRIADASMPMYTALALPAGQRLTLDPPQGAMYTYVAVSGGIATRPVFGSRSTVVREGLGGHEGRPLRHGDVLPLGSGQPGEGFRARGQRQPHRPLLRLRFLPCFQHPAFPAASRQQLLHTTFRVSGHSDRMGARLEGPAIASAPTRLYSESTCLGAIQVPPDGQPIVLLRDRQTLGGYPKLGAVVAADCARLAQALPGQKVRFEPVTEDEAERVRWLTANYRAEQVLMPVTLPASHPVVGPGHHGDGNAGR